MPATKQPDWKFVSNLGDAHYLESGGIFIYRDATGVYEAEAEILEVGYEGPSGDETLNRYVCYRFILDRWKIEKGYLVPFEYGSKYSHPINNYRAWFSDDLGKIADCVGATKEDLIKGLCSEDPCQRAFVYMSIGGYHGMENLDEYPIRLNYNEARDRYLHVKEGSNDGMSS